MIALIALGLASFRRPSEPQRLLKASILPPQRATFGPTISSPSVPGRFARWASRAFAAAADGKTSLWVRDLDSLAARPLAGTEGAYYPFWSPDSRFIAFFVGGKLKKIDVAGGPALTLCDAANARGGSLANADVIVFTRNLASGLFPCPHRGRDHYSSDHARSGGGAFFLMGNWL